MRTYFLTVLVFCLNTNLRLCEDVEMTETTSTTLELLSVSTTTTSVTEQEEFADSITE